MIPVDVGSARKCSSESCGRKIFPRIDPAIIVNVSFGDYCLLGRKATWPRAMYSCLAGFAEVGETLEETVVREMFEESGVRIKPSSIRYGSSLRPQVSFLMCGNYRQLRPNHGHFRNP
mmetsp:Transcript_1599/g.3667  ORF Transcript_1599/g.3667 Transcript_1599/m.3667 type:complete len:118 (-) Transcript_1599:454-807(-)